MTVMVFPVYAPKVFDKAVQCILSALSGTIRPAKIVVVDNSDRNEFPLYYRGANSPNNLPEIEIVTFCRGIGLTGTWNYAFTRFEHEQHLLLPGDDCVFHNTTLEDMLDAMRTTSGLFYYPAHITDPVDRSMSPWSFFIMQRYLWEKVGPFDINFPVYFADNDYYYRIKLAGIDVDRVMIPVDTTAGHWGSATVKSLEGSERSKHNSHFEYLKSVYQRKWGGLPNVEKFKTPFNK